MKKYLRPIIFIATFVTAGIVLALYSFFTNSHNTILWNIDSLLPLSQHSTEYDSPHAELDGKTVHIRPYDASFEIPDGWLTTKPAPDEHVKNLFLSWQDLNELGEIDHEMNGSDSDEAEVISSILPFDDCVAHVGDRGWGNFLWNDLQGRVYVTDLTPDLIAANIEKEGLNKATRLFTRASLLKPQDKGKWKALTMDIFDAPSWSDFMLGERLDFYVRAFDDKTVVFVFLHTDSYSDEISLLLTSFKWQHAPASKLTPIP